MAKPHNAQSLIAVDGGGTRCRLVLAEGGRVIRVDRGSANVSTDFDAAVGELTAGLTDLAGQSGRPFADLVRVPAYLGLAGVTGPDIAARVADALPLAVSRIEDDRRAALTGALAGGDGFVAHCGTGSFVAARVDGRTRLVGGWGLVLGDPASAGWVGRQALARTLEAVDGLAEPTPLASALLADLGGPAGIVAWAAKAGPASFGALAPRVTTAAAGGDGLARAVMADAATGLAGLLERLGWRAGATICLTGGIGPHFAGYLPDTMRADLAEPAGAPIDGALALARELAEVTRSGGKA
ncbi:MAG: BadF/BadG/BcrA/BcrD ATPase family protein [Marinibacterium sp.]